MRTRLTVFTPPTPTFHGGGGVPFFVRTLGSNRLTYGGRMLDEGFGNRIGFHLSKGNERWFLVIVQTSRGFG